MNLIGLDISITSTGLSIIKNNELKLYNFTTTKKNYKWIKKSINYIDMIPLLICKIQKMQKI